MTTPPRARLIALGASNIARGGMRLLDAARARAGGPVEALLAMGRGRSYGVRSSLLGRTLPGIDDCGLWDALERGERRPATALVMDVGNDILYAFAPDAILRWVDDALGRLRPHAADLRLGGLPVASAARLGPVRFALVRRLLVPGCRLDLRRALGHAEAVDQGLRQLAERHGAAFVPLPSHWFGFDIVHVRRRWQRAAFAALLGTDAPAQVPPPAGPLDGPLARLRFLHARPDRRWWFGREVRGAQPALRFADGTTVAMY